ncbi:MAG: hypothetical protein ACLPXT_14190 [Terracidiphilus sp.]
MHIRPAFAFLILAGISGCANQAKLPTTPATPAAVTHAYNGTASVGDFLTIIVNSTALTITYSNVSNGDSGTVPYTVNGNGSYTINDPTGNLLSAYEVPGYALMIQSAKSGPDHLTPALITAVESGPISLSTFANHSYNYMSFRTASGGVEIGSITIGTTSGNNTNYWPYGNTFPGSGGAFGGGPMDFSGLISSGTYLSGPVGGSGDGTDYIFGTASGFFIVDTPNGSIIGLPKAASAALDPSMAGTYSAIFYQKTNATTGAGNVESGTASTGQATIVIDSLGNITATDSTSNIFINNAALTPVASASYLYGTGSDGKLTDPCNGLFTFRSVNAARENDVFVTFVGNSVIFSKFNAIISQGNFTGTYNYWYGVGLKQ